MQILVKIENAEKRLKTEDKNKDGEMRDFGSLRLYT